MVRRVRSFLCLSLLALGAITGPVRAQNAQDPIYVFQTTLGNISVQLYPDIAPQTVANFLRYVNAGAYTNSLIHRSMPGFIIQGGGYFVQNGSSIEAIPTNAPVINEFHLSNTRGTIAMAKLGNDQNSATSEWFFNESDSNAANLDNQNGGFTVFGKVLDSASLAVMDQIAAVPVPNPSPFSSPLNQIPLLNYTNGAAVQESNLVIVSSIAPAAGVHLLWDNTSGAASVWNYSSLNGTFTQQTYGPYSSWTAKAVADGGTDSQTRLLWDKTDGAASLWSLNNVNGTFTDHDFGPYANWTANAVSVGSDNTTHLLWTNTNGAASLWNYSTMTGSYTQNTYGPYAGWTAQAIADGGTDGRTRLLWDKTDGTASIWSLNNATGSFTDYNFGPYANWTATAVSVGSDNTTHILWDNTNGTASLWNYSTATGSFTQNTYGPYAGWTAKAIADGPNGTVQLQWDNTSGSASLWSLNNTTGVFGQFSFGPYSGWTATGTSEGL